MSDAFRWATSRYTGLFTALDRFDPEPHDPPIDMVAGTLGLRGPQRVPLVVGGAGFDPESARLACVGEALERFEGWLGEGDGRVRATFEGWTRDEPALAPSAVVLFTAEQYRSDHFPFAPFTAETETTWVCFRRIDDGTAVWVPDAFASLYAAPGEAHDIAPKISTGLAAGRIGDPVVRRALEEVIERDALTRAWWGEYALEEIEPARAFAVMRAGLRERAERPHLRYRFFRIRTPHAAHATLVTTLGDERSGVVFSTGSACRARRGESLEKALLEALQGRLYVRHQLAAAPATPDGPPRDFREHVLHYSRAPARLRDTVLYGTMCAEDPVERERVETLDALLERLPSAPLFRLATPPSLSGVAHERSDAGFMVVKVVAPGLVPLHADHRMAHLGCAWWQGRPLAEWLAHPPHPFA